MASGGWLIVPRDTKLDAAWRERAIDVVLLPLFAEEAARLLTGDMPPSVLDQEDQRLVRLVAQRLTFDAIARRLNVSRRTVERRMARIREKTGAATNADLLATIGGPVGVRQGDVGGTRASVVERDTRSADHGDTRSADHGDTRSANNADAYRIEPGGDLEGFVPA